MPLIFQQTIFQLTSEILISRPLKIHIYGKNIQPGILVSFLQAVNEQDKTKQFKNKLTWRDGYIKFTGKKILYTYNLHNIESAQIQHF